MKIKAILISLVAAVPLFAAGCAAKRPPDLERAQAKLQEAKNDTFVVKNAPLELNQAEKTYVKADEMWRETKDKSQTVALAVRAQDEVDNARLQAGKNAALELSRDVSQQQKLLSKEQELRLAEERARIAGETIAANRIVILELQNLNEEQRRQRLLVSLENDVMFDVDGAYLTPGGERQLDPLVSYLRDNPDSQVDIEGHTDSTGDEAHNLVLSARRAEAVERYLVARGVPPSRIVSEGKGEAYPIASNDSSAGRLQNRRVEVLITPRHY